MLKCIGFNTFPASCMVVNHPLTSMIFMDHNFNKMIHKVNRGSQVSFNC